MPSGQGGGKSEPIDETLREGAPGAAPAPERYRPLRLLGAGGMGEVYLAAQEGPQGFRRVVALKRIRPAATEHQRLLAQHFLDEARLVAKLSHRNVVQIHELGEGPEGLFVAMEFVRGPSVERLLDRLAASGAKMPPALALDVAAQVADGLDYAYSAKDEAGAPLRIVHRDVSTQNVLVSVTGDVKLIDFGVAKSTSQQRVTTSPVVKGKIAYMSPEQSRAEPLDGRSDLFCLGIVLYEMLVGAHPFLRADPLSTLKSIEAANWPRLAQAAPELAVCDPLLERLLARSAEDRFPNGAAVSDAIALVRPSVPAPPSRLGPFVAGLFGADFEGLERPEPGFEARGFTPAPLASTTPSAGSRPTKDESAPTMLRTPGSGTGGPGAVSIVPLPDSGRRSSAAGLLAAGAVPPAPSGSSWRKLGFAAAMLGVGVAGGLAATLALRPPPAEKGSDVPGIPTPAVQVVASRPPSPEVPSTPEPSSPRAADPVAKPAPDDRPPARPTKPGAVAAPPTPRATVEAPRAAKGDGAERPLHEITVDGPGGTSRIRVGRLPQEVVLMEVPFRVEVNAAPGKATLDCQPWQIVSVNGESIGKSPVAIPGTDRWPVTIGLRNPDYQRVELELSIRSLEATP